MLDEATSPRAKPVEKVCAHTLQQCHNLVPAVCQVVRDGELAWEAKGDGDGATVPYIHMYGTVAHSPSPVSLRHACAMSQGMRGVLAVQL